MDLFACQLPCSVTQPYHRSLAVLAEHHIEMGKAIEYLQEAASLAEEIGLLGDLWLVHAALGELFLKQGETEQAHGAFVKSAIVAQGLADSMNNEGQRLHFLTSPQIEH